MKAGWAVFNFFIYCSSSILMCETVCGGDAPAKIANVAEAITWLEQTSAKIIRDSRRDMPNGISAFPPQVGIGYEAFWLRDYAYMLEGNVNAFTDKELKDACRFFINGIRADGAGVDCIKFDGTPIYKPGFGSMGENPVADGSQFTVIVAWQTYQKTQDKEFLRKIVDALIKTMRACPRNPQTGMVFIDPAKTYDRCPYGFTDTVRKTGDEFFCSLLFIQASQHLAAMLRDLNRSDDAAYWSSEAQKIAANLNGVFWDENVGLFRAATVQCKEPDIWGSAFAVYLGLTSVEQTRRIANYFKDHYSELVQRGQLRHTPKGIYWEKAGERDQYQNGGYWATPMGWFIYTLSRIDPQLADRAIVDFANEMRELNFPEWSFGARVQLPGYCASAALPLAGIRKMKIGN